MKYTKPSTGFLSILSGKTRQGRVGFNFIVHDVKKATADLSSYKQSKILSTLRKIQANPRSVGTHDAREALQALEKTGHLASAYKGNVAGAVSHLRAQTGSVGGSTRAEMRIKQRVEAAGMSSGVDNGSALTGKAKKEHMRKLACERRDAAKAEVEKAGAGQTGTTSASHMGKEMEISAAGTKKSDVPPTEEVLKKLPVDIMID